MLLAQQRLRLFNIQPIEIGECTARAIHSLNDTSFSSVVKHRDAGIACIYISINRSAVRKGWRQSIPSKSIESCAELSDTDPILRLGPDEATAFQSLRHQAKSGSIPPQELDQIAAPAAKDEQMTAQRIACKRALHQSAKPGKAFAHIGRAGSQPNARTRRHARRHDSHCCNCATSAPTKAPSSAPVSMRSVEPHDSVIARCLGYQPDRP